MSYVRSCRYSRAARCRPVSTIDECPAEVRDALAAQQGESPQSQCALYRRQRCIMSTINAERLLSVAPVLNGDADIASKRLRLRRTALLLAQLLVPEIRSPFRPVFD